MMVLELGRAHFLSVSGTGSEPTSWVTLVILAMTALKITENGKGQSFEYEMIDFVLLIKSTVVLELVGW